MPLVPVPELTTATLSGLITGRMPVATSASTIGNSNFTASGNVFDLAAAGTLTIGPGTAGGVAIGRAGTLVTFPGGVLRATTPTSPNAAVSLQFGPGNGASANGVGFPATDGGPILVLSGAGGNGDANNAPANGASITLQSGGGGTVGAFGGGGNSGDIIFLIGNVSGSGASGTYRWKFGSTNAMTLTSNFILSPNTTSTGQVGDSLHVWNAMYSNTFRGNALDVISAGTLGLGTSLASAITIGAGANTTGGITASSVGGLIVSQPAVSSGTPSALNIQVGAHTGLTASTEVSDLVLGLTSHTWLAGNITLQRFARIAQPTIAFASGSNTVTEAATLSIAGKPAAGANATITNAYGLLMENDAPIGWKIVSGGGVPTYTTRSVGTRLVISPNLTAGSLDNAIGNDAGGNMWVSTHGNNLNFYLGDSLSVNAALINTGTLSLKPAGGLSSLSQGATNTTGMTISPNVADGASSIGLVVNNVTATPSGKLLSLQSAGTEKTYFDGNGRLNITSSAGANSAGSLNISGPAGYWPLNINGSVGGKFIFEDIAPGINLANVNNGMTTFTAAGYATGFTFTGDGGSGNINTDLVQVKGPASAGASSSLLRLTMGATPTAGAVAQIVQWDGIGTGSASPGISVRNTTAATSGAQQQYSPMLELEGQAWNTTSSASKAQKMGLQLVPQNGATTSPALVFFESTDGGAYSAVSSLDSYGNLSLNGSATAVGLLNSGRVTGAYRATTSPVTVTTDDYIVAVGGSGTRSVALPAANTCTPGQQILVQETGGSSLTITITANGTDSINSSNVTTISAAYGAILLWTDGVSHWYIV